LSVVGVAESSDTSVPGGVTMMMEPELAPADDTSAKFGRTSGVLVLVVVTVMVSSV
jgi:hypothetical protein